jgi:hypothetical protein
MGRNTQSKPRKTKTVKYDPVSMTGGMLGLHNIPYDLSTGGDATWYAAS